MTTDNNAMTTQSDALPPLEALASLVESAQLREAVRDLDKNLRCLTVWAPAQEKHAAIIASVKGE